MRHHALLLMMTLLAAGCAGPQPTAPTMSTPTIPVSTPAPVPSLTAILTETPAPFTVPAQPVTPAAPVAKLPLPSPYDGPLPDGALAQLGYGEAQTRVISPDGHTLAVGMASGVALYDLPAERLRVFTRTPFPVDTIDWSPDSSSFLAIANGWLDAWRHPAGALMSADDNSIRYMIDQHTMIITSVDWSPDGSTFLTAGEDGLLLIWDADSGQVRSRIVTTVPLKDYTFESDKYAGTEQYASFNADGSLIVNYFWQGADAPEPYRFFTVWDARTGRQVTQYNEDRYINSATWHPTDPDLLLLDSSREISTYSVSRREESRRQPYESDIQFPGARWSPDGSLVYPVGSAAGLDAQTPFLDAKTLDVRFVIPHAARNIRFYKDWIVIDRSAYSAPDAPPTVWDRAAGAEVKAVDHIVPQWMEGALIGGTDQRTGRAVALHTTSGMRLDDFGQNQLRGAGPISSLAWSPDGKQLLTVGEAATLWDVDTAAPLDSHLARLSADTSYAEENYVSWVGRSPVIGEHRAAVTLWNPDGPLSYSIPEDPADYLAALVDAAAVSPDEKLIALGNQGRAVLFDPRAETFTILPGFPGTELAWSPDGRHLAGSNPFSRILAIWDTSNGREVARMTAEVGDVTARGVAWSPGGSTLARATAGQEISLIGVGSWQVTSRLDVHLPGADQDNVAINAIAWSGDRLAVAYETSPKWDTHTLPGTWPQDTIILWDVRTGQAVKTFNGHNGSVSALAFSPDGRLLASVDQRGMALIWRAR